MVTRIKKFFIPPVFESQEKTLMAHNSFTLAIVGTTLSFFLAILFLIISPENIFRNIVIALTFFLGLIEIFFLHKGFVRQTILFQATVIWGGVVATSISTGGVHSIGFVGGTIAALLVMGIALEWRSMVIFIGASILAASFMVWGENQGFIDPSRILEKPILIVATYSAFLFILAGLLYVTYQSIIQALAQARKEVQNRRYAEAQIRLMNAELDQRVHQRTAQLEALNQELETFSYSVSHDLRSPLRSIIGYTQILLEDYAVSLDPDACELLEKVVASGSKMNQLIDELLNFSRLQQTQLNITEVNTSELVNNVIESFALETNHRQIEWIIADLPPLQADPLLLEQVYVNLIDNAIKYTRERAEARIELNCRIESDENIFFVRDNGAGFDMRYADRLFGVFQRLHNDAEFEGIGIGLATVQRILMRHNGRIWAEAEPNQGATFYFTIGQIPNQASDDIGRKHP